MPGSEKLGKKEIKKYFLENINKDKIILDIGAGSGGYKKLLKEYSMIGVEVFAPYIERYKLREIYEEIIEADARFVKEENGLVIFNEKAHKIDVVILGDVLEHMLPLEARNMLNILEKCASEIFVIVPYLYKQKRCFGNDFEIHHQDDLTFEIFKERYPEFIPLFIMEKMGIYVWKGNLC